jgi:hypothetical protein
MRGARLVGVVILVRAAARALSAAASGRRHPPAAGAAAAGAAATHRRRQAGRLDGMHVVAQVMGLATGDCSPCVVIGTETAR